VSSRDESARSEAIEKLALALGTGVPGHPQNFEAVAAEIVDLITEHAVETFRALVEAEAVRGRG
jgi:hypothetical protein